MKKLELAVQKSMKKQEVDRMVLEKKLKNQRNEQKRHRVIETEQLKKKFDNTVQEMNNRHLRSVAVLDKAFEKTIANRPRYNAMGSVSSKTSHSMSQNSFRSTAERSRLLSAKGGRR